MRRDRRGRRPPGVAEAGRFLAVLAGAGLVSASAGAAPRPPGTEPNVPAVPLPAFSRLYGTGCSTCHTAAPKLNVFGEAFRLNGYRMPATEASARRDEPVPLGAPEWDGLWPGAIRSSSLPGIPPVALRIVSDVGVTNDGRKPYTTTFRFPDEISLLAGAPLGDDLSAFFEGGWSPEEGFEVTQARVELHDIVPGLPPRALNVRLGRQHLYLLTLADHHIDRAGRQPWGWQAFDPSEVELSVSGAASPVASSNRLILGGSQSAVELNGVIGGRLYYGVGLSQGVEEGASDANAGKDVYYKVRYKAGGLDLTGRYPEGGEPIVHLPGQLLDRSVTLEHFGYFGDEATPEEPQGVHRALGVAARALMERWDLGLGYVTRDFSRPWSDLATGDLEVSSAYARVEYLLLPWLLASLKGERTSVSASELPTGTSVVVAPGEATRVNPGVVLLLRQNLRLVVEGDVLLRHPDTDRAGLPRPHDLWVRLDLAF